jgi:prepilin-type N-terminal cleavage/methylation domain-containing protein
VTRARGFTLLETMIAVSLMGGLAVMVGGALRVHSNASGQATNDAQVFLPATRALAKLERELAGVVIAPAGVTAAPLYAVSGTSITFRPCLGPIDPADPSLATASAEGRVSSSGVLYAPYAVTIAYDAATSRVLLTRQGTLGSLPAQEVVARDVSVFRLFDGESQQAAPADATPACYVLGIRLVVSRRSASPLDAGRTVTSDLGSIALTTKARLGPETLSTTRTRPLVTPP